jgi:diguanylate cyclase (GGDEF)-like protein
MSWLKAGWTEPDQYDWVTSFLRQRGMLRMARAIMSVVAGSAALPPLAELFDDRRFAWQTVAVNAVTVAYTVGMVVFWSARWPTRRQSQAVVAFGVFCIGAWGLAQPNATLGALACLPMAVTGGYSAVFHSPRMLIAHSAVAVAITVGAVIRLAHQADIPAVAAFWLINFVNLAVALGFWGMSRAIRTYAHRSDQDSLTGLLNRRALAHAVGDRVAHPPQMHTRLGVMMVDLDNFKGLNDTHGHPAGDDALRRVARLLREHTPADAIICRAGGEEFLIALTAVSFDMRTLATGICTAIAGLSPMITASIGTASAELHSLIGPHATRLVDDLIRIADQAMYVAKRQGGNQAQHA